MHGHLSSKCVLCQVRASRVPRFTTVIALLCRRVQSQSVMEKAKRLCCEPRGKATTNILGGAGIFTQTSALYSSVRRTYRE